jgi:hypothetical protein
MRGAQQLAPGDTASARAPGSVLGAPQRVGAAHLLDRLAGSLPPVSGNSDGGGGSNSPSMSISPPLTMYFDVL